MRTACGRPRGAALIIVLMLLASLATLAGVFFATASLAMDSEELDEQRTAARWAAEAGVEQALWHVGRAMAFGAAPPERFAARCNDCDVVVTLRESSPETYEAEAEATFAPDGAGELRAAPVVIARATIQADRSARRVRIVAWGDDGH